MNAAREFVFEQIIDKAMPRDARFAGKRLRNDKNSKMALACARRITMACVQLGLVDDVKPYRFEPDHKLFAKSASNGHLFLS